MNFPLFSTSKMSLGRKIILLTTFSVTFGLVLAYGSVLVHEVCNDRDQQYKQFLGSVNTLSAASSNILDDHGQIGFQELLEKWCADSDVQCAALYDQKGNVLAQFPADKTAFQPPVLNRKRESHMGWNEIVVVQDVLHNGKYLGTVFAKMDTSAVWWHLGRFTIVLAVVFATAVAGASYLAWRLQAEVMKAVTELANVARDVTQKRDYSIRVPPQPIVELLDLERALNGMLERVQNSDLALQSAHNELENEVRERTAELTKEIRERETIQLDLANAKELAEAANRAKSEFLANMSHEMRTPLNGILGFTQLLQRDAEASPAERADYLATIHSSGQHLLELINDILDLSKIEAGHMDLEFIPCSTRRIVADVVSLLRVRAQEKGLSLEYEFLGKVPETIVSDPARVKQLLMNLVSNAVKFTSEGSVRVVAAMEYAEKNPLLRFDVVDTGIGIPNEKQESIFDPFVQADNSVTRCFGGTGLGLAISRRITRMMGGDLTVCSTVGMGSVFSATVSPGDLAGVPFVEIAGGDIAAGPEELREQPSSIAGAKLLVVDDGATNRKLISVILRRAGAEVSSAENGRQAVELIQRSDFDLVFMDMQMPVMDGYTATKTLREMGKTLPVIALTANAMKGDEQKCVAAGCTGYLTKPVDAKKLIQTTLDWLGKGSSGKTQVPSKPSANVSVKPETTVVVKPTSQESQGKLPPLKCELPLEDPEFLSIAHEFVSRLAPQLGDLKSAIDQGDFETTRSLSHWLKGAAGTVGFRDFTDPAHRLESAAEKKDAIACARWFDVVQELAQRIELPEAVLQTVTE